MRSVDLEIRKFVYKIRARLREQSVIDSVCCFALLGLGLALAVSVFSMFVPFYYAIIVAAGVLAIAFIVGMIMGLNKTPTPMEAALKADAKGYKEKISTAFFVAGKEDAFSVLLKNEVVGIAERFSVRKEFPLSLSWKRLAVILLLAVLFVVTSQMGTPARELARLRHEVGKEAKEEIAELEKVEKAIKESKDISEAEKAEITEQLENAKRELEEAESFNELDKASERIAKKMELKSEQTENKTLSETLNKAAVDMEERTAKKNKELADAAKEVMEKAQNGTGRDKKEAYEKLKDLADNLDDEALEAAANNYKESGYSDADYTAAKAAMNKALDANNSATDMANNSTGQDSNQNNNQNSSQASGNASQGQSGNSSQSQNGSGSQNGNGNQNGNGGQNGNGNQNGNGQGGKVGSNGGSGGGGWNYGSKDGKEGPQKIGEDITVPDGEIGDDENLTGKANGNGSSIKAESNQANAWSGNKVSYGQVSGKYKDKAYKKINGSDYPGKLKDKIRNYFDGLN